nr:Trp operon leader peptide [Vibrio mexicanus]
MLQEFNLAPKAKNAFAALNMGKSILVWWRTWSGSKWAVVHF